MLHLARVFSISLSVGLSFSIAGCATKARYDQDSQSAAYEQRTTSFRNSVIKPGGSTYDAGNGVINAATGLVFEKNYYQPTAIKGSCLLVGKGDPLGVSCNGTILILLDADQKEIARTQVKADGSFGFHGEKGKPYYITVDSKRLRVSEESRGPVMVGDTVTLRIGPSGY